MSNLKSSLDELMKIDGAIGACIVDFKSGLSLGSSGGGAMLNVEVAGAGNTEVVRSKMKVMQQLGLKDRIEDILITLGGQYHVIRPLSSNPSLFIYVAVNRNQANLALTRFKIQEVEGKLVV